MLARQKEATYLAAKFAIGTTLFPLSLKRGPLWHNGLLAWGLVSSMFMEGRKSFYVG